MALAWPFQFSSPSLLAVPHPCTDCSPSVLPQSIWGLWIGRGLPLTRLGLMTWLRTEHPGSIQGDRTPLKVWPDLLCHTAPAAALELAMKSISGDRTASFLGTRAHKPPSADMLLHCPRLLLRPNSLSPLQAPRHSLSSS